MDEIGLWREGPDPTRGFAFGPALFLDRDGVLIDDTGYLHDPAGVVLIPGVAALVAACNRAAVPVVVVTNQSGIGRGYYGWPDFVAVQARLAAMLAAAEADARLDMVLACAYHPEADGDFAILDHPWRKPNPGMLHAAADALPIDLARSWIIGDRATDLAAARAAGLAGGLHLSGATDPISEERRQARNLASEDFAVIAARSLTEAGGVVERLTNAG
ncbi:MAG: HAD-IIIA family hydrolase [Alphaproteobacteria bacterium]